MQTADMVRIKQTLGFAQEREREHMAKTLRSIANHLEFAADTIDKLELYKMELDGISRCLEAHIADRVRIERE